MSGLWDMVVGGIKDWIIQKVVQQAILKIATMWNPAGAIIQLIETAWNVYQWVRENAQRIFGLVQAVVDSISNIVAGNIGGAANFIEASLAKLVPVAISLFADLIGLGGIADKIKGIIERVQTKVDEAIDKLIARVMAMFKGKDKAKEDGEGAEDVVRVQVEFAMSGEGHTLTGVLDKASLDVTMASVPRPFGDKLTAARKAEDDLAKLGGPDQAKHEQARDALDALEQWYEAEKLKVTSDPDKSKRTSGMNQLINDLKDRVIAVGNAHGLKDFVYESFGIDKMLQTIDNLVNKELRKHYGKPNVLGDGHNNTATAAEALGVKTNHGKPLTYAEQHADRTRTCQANLDKVLKQMDALDAAHPTLGLSKLPEYQTAKSELADCDLALSNPVGYLAGKGYKVIAGDFQ